MLKLGITLIAALCVLVALPRPASAEIGEVEKEILDVMAEQIKAWNDGSVEGFMEGYWNSENLRFASGDEIFFGWDKVLARYERRYPTKRRMGTLTFTDMDVTLLGDDAAMVFGKWKVRKRHERSSGLFTLIFRKTADGWRIVHDHTSS